MLKEKINEAIDIIDHMLIRTEDPKMTSDLWAVKEVLVMLDKMIECEEVSPESIDFPS